MSAKVIYQLPIIHNRHKYKGKSTTGYAEKCYEWPPRTKCSWETVLVFLVIADGKAKKKGSKAGDPDTPVAGLAMKQTLTILTEFFGPDQKSCGTYTFLFKELFPVEASGQLLSATVTDMHAHGHNRVLGCRVATRQLCRLVSTVTSEVVLVTGTVNGQPIKASDVKQGDKAVVESVQGKYESADGKEKNDSGEKRNPEKDVKSSPIDGQESDKYTYVAKVDHCDVSTITIPASEYPAEDIPAGEVPPDKRAPATLEKEILDSLAMVSIPRGGGMAAAVAYPSRPAPYAAVRPVPAHVVLGAAFGMAHESRRRARLRADSAGVRPISWQES